jgi:hypothetical protein
MSAIHYPQDSNSVLLLRLVVKYQPCQMIFRFAFLNAFGHLMIQDMNSLSLSSVFAEYLLSTRFKLCLTMEIGCQLSMSYNDLPICISQHICYPPQIQTLFHYPVCSPNIYYPQDSNYVTLSSSVANCQRRTTIFRFTFLNVFAIHHKI